MGRSFVFIIAVRSENISDWFSWRRFYMIYVVTNRILVEKGTILQAVERAAISGAQAVILREKDLEFKDLLLLGSQVKNITDRYDVPLIINGSIKVAKLINAYGVQLTYEAMNSVGESGSIRFGVSIHSVEEAIEAEKKSAKYIIAGNIYDTSCKPGLKGKGIKFVKELSNNISIPIIAIGGINISNAKEVMESGASGVAIMSSAMSDYDGSFVRRLKEGIIKGNNP